MNIIERASGFVKSLRELSKRTAWDWKRCPKCGESDTIRYGTYTSHPWFLDGRRAVVIQRHRCNRCSASGKTFTYSEQSAYLVRGSWYAREVHRYGIDLWQHGRSTLRRSAEFVRSLVGRQERWLIWRCLDEAHSRDKGDECHLSASTLHRWLDGAGQEAQRTVKGQLEGVPTSGQVGADGLWARLRGKAKRVVLVLVDSVSGIVYPPVVVDGEDSEESWKRLFARAKRAGLPIQRLRGVTSDGASGLLAFVGRVLDWVNQQRCVFHIWRGLGRELARRSAEAAKGLVGEAAETARRQARKERKGTGQPGAKGDRRQERGRSRGGARPTACPSAGLWSGRPGGGAPGCSPGAPEPLQSGTLASGARVALAGLSAAAESGTQPRLGSAT